MLTKPELQVCMHYNDQVLKAYVDFRACRRRQKLSKLCKCDCDDVRTGLRQVSDYLVFAATAVRGGGFRSQQQTVNVWHAMVSDVTWIRVEGSTTESDVDWFHPWVG